MTSQQNLKMSVDFDFSTLLRFKRLKLKFNADYIQESESTYNLTLPMGQQALLPCTHVSDGLNRVRILLIIS